jgi:hypothetical protein
MKSSWKIIFKIVVSIVGGLIGKNNPKLSNEIDKGKDIANKTIDEL